LFQVPVSLSIEAALSLQSKSSSVDQLCVMKVITQLPIVIDSQLAGSALTSKLRLAFTSIIHVAFATVCRVRKVDAVAETLWKKNKSHNTALSNHILLKKENIS
jgi:hypothetical protein